MHIVPISNTYVGHNVTHIFHYNLQLITFDNDGGPVVSVFTFLYDEWSSNLSLSFWSIGTVLKQ